ncbi:ubiquinone/menaquinone biosynthesis C-methyltransferase UbiE [Oxobacter pfennigii]|uniref:Arsenite methyltransferase n=1 Tax=Oxobacter pfennigii TaxID=36849 RepID=A0A0P9AKI9_9CLOT|nr:arsenite methyltransferase [Oxobacter pfennigii]KPU45866.1 ubiquinone/menaquinone biosynthesis C-methyltransferase UbiE [Oxobacter pfennigii]
MSSEIKEKVKEYYGSIAKQVDESAGCSCSSSSSCCVSDNSIIYDMDYLMGLPVEAINASLGCANPIAFAELKEGETILDLGSGGGIDCFIASRYAGNSGKVYGLDMTDEMLKLANKNKEKIGVKNVEFIKGEIENIPFPEEKFDVILSNCVINLCESKEKALSEVYRVLKKGGRLAIADIIALKDVPDNMKRNVEMWAGCIAGALHVDEYRAILEKAGFKNIEIEPVNIYTKEVIESIAGSKDIEGILNGRDIDLLDGAYAGASVKAIK